MHTLAGSNFTMNKEVGCKMRGQDVRLAFAGLPMTASSLL
jgi:hypothetical protein